METPRRIYFQYQPDEPSLDRLRAVRSEAKAAYGGNPIPDRELHLTLLHFGLADQIFGDIRKVNNSLTRPNFDRATRQFITDAGRHMPASFDVTLHDYRRYGADHSVLVGLVEPGTELLSAQAAVAGELRTMLGRLGVGDTDGFIRSNRSLWAALDYQPHISLLTAAGYASELPELHENLHLTAVPINYDLAHERLT